MTKPHILFALLAMHWPLAAAEPRECYAAGVDDWDKGLQIGAVFIILAVSLVGVLLPILCKHTKWLSISPRVINTGKFFGAGVILATAFIHMLGESMETLKDECLDAHMGDFDSWPGALAMMAVLAMHLLEHILSARFAKKKTEDIDSMLYDSESEKDTGHTHGPVLGHTKKLSTYILELGIALHSVIIGMTLAVTGSGFRVLLAAIACHQFFEGVALGTRIAELEFPANGLLLRVANALMFAVTTPVGQVIGICIRQSFAPRDPSSLMVMGVLDSLSAGILIYSAVVGLLVEEFGAAEFHASPRWLRVLYFAAMYLGCATMSLIGKWA
ncbi:hypothetical protein EDC05_004506 [Coemansia umbellata]|nr:hypothetical protein EDC05_004506 [Coemansia umbellata]